MTNAEKIKAARVKLGLSQSQFARALGLSRKATVSDWERGIKAPANYVWLAIESLQVALPLGTTETNSDSGGILKGARKSKKEIKQ